MIRRLARFDDAFVLIFASIHSVNANAGERFADEVEATLDRLKVAPRMGSRARFDNAYLAGIRFVTIRGYRNYLLFYRPIKGGVEAVDLLHGAQDIEAIFNST